MSKFIGGIIGLALCIFILQALLGKLGSATLDSINKEKLQYEVNIGKEMVLEKDTLTIIDFSTLDETYTLSNGLKVSKGIVNNAKFIN